MILGRLFARLFELGVVVVATSNVAPAELYKDGLNRALFLPFIAMLEQHMEVVRARGAHRLPAGEARRPEGLVCAGRRRRPTAALDGRGGGSPAARAACRMELSVKGRRLRVPRAAMGVARFSFHDLCEQPLGAADYLRIAHEFHTLIIDHIPVMDFDQRNDAKRFIILIDTLYDHAREARSPRPRPSRTRLYEASDGFEAVEFKRTASRLIEMRSQSLSRRCRTARRDSARPAASSEGIVET